MLLLVLIVTTSLCRSLAQLEGDGCRLKSSAPGVCRRLLQCQGARAALQQGTTPQLCSRRGRSPLGLLSGAAAPARDHEYAQEYTLTAWKRERSPVLLLDDSGEDSNYAAECGLEGTSPLIIGGTQAQPKEFPHMAAVGFGEKNDSISWVCGGALISEWFILTAGHCVQDPKGLDGARWVLLGDVALEGDSPSASRQLIAVAERIAHPQYRRPLKYNDIALLRLEHAAHLGGYVRPACLHTEASVDTDKAIATGWGSTSTQQMTIEDLMKVELTIQPTAQCQKTFNVSVTPSLRSSLPEGIQEESMLCVGELAGGKDTCQGDSGGPLQVPMDRNHCMYKIVGVTSFGRSCARPNQAAVYTRVSYYVPWIESIVWNSTAQTEDQKRHTAHRF